MISYFADWVGEKLDGMTGVAPWLWRVAMLLVIVMCWTYVWQVVT